MAKYFRARNLLIFGLIICAAGFILGNRYADSGCGVCPGYYMPSLDLFIDGVPKKSNINPEMCRYVGCSPLVIPIFMDVYLLGFVSIAVSVLMKIRSVKSVK